MELSVPSRLRRFTPTTGLMSHMRLIISTPSAIPPTIALGIKLRSVDFAVSDFFNASNNDEKRARETNVRAAVSDAAEECMKLSDLLVKSAKK
jgi:hypothetical protein